mmetsp:Transcript_20200/g.24891  ORF Transcript_20200/g.24891 Transcript_20200/m.24891 type:complete len:353 (+) Transcript_20200:74-1132(+)
MSKEELKKALSTVQDLKATVESKRQTKNDTIIKTIIGGNDSGIKELGLQQRKEMTGHFGKIYSLNFSSNSESIVTASQDGKLIIWNALTQNKYCAITLNSSWVMNCVFSPSIKFVASGGLDNKVTIHKVEPTFVSKELYTELEAHDGYVSCCRFIDDHEIISASGDSNIILWDIATQKFKQQFNDHSSDVMSVSLNKQNKTLFCTGSVDNTVKVWDIRTSNHCIYNFVGHEQDVNSVQFFRDNNSILSGSDDGSVRLYDMKSYSQVQQCKDATNKSSHDKDEISGITSLDSSNSGAYIFSAYDNGKVYIWNTLTAKNISSMAHEERVSCLQVSPNGYGVATGCWDFMLRVFA